MSVRCFALFLCVSLFIIHTAESGEILDKIKGGLDAAYDGLHCGFHTIKEFVKHHEHDIDPCTGKTPTTPSPSKVEEINTETSDINYDGESKPTEVNYGWRV
ncbi:hypothetical protein NQ317_005964 [Molorchus minor]|uniref:Uncharacterized protein n=1 Tax=Molorchus minor TaxID=1323400 RepID=A0ABQ9JL84_9CUCU|nr:hypothetical protein NQ317_005964 [Molorchus minor]